MQDQEPISRSNTNYDVAKYLYGGVKSQLEQRLPPACRQTAHKSKVFPKVHRAGDRERKSLLAPGVRDALPLIGVIAPHCSCLANLIILTQIQILTEVRHLPPLAPLCVSLCICCLVSSLPVPPFLPEAQVVTPDSVTWSGLTHVIPVYLSSPTLCSSRVNSHNMFTN